jgi:hypothetical protein
MDSLHQRQQVYMLDMKKRSLIYQKIRKAILAIFTGNGVTKQMYDGFRKPVQLKVRTATYRENRIFSDSVQTLHTKQE